MAKLFNLARMTTATTGTGTVTLGSAVSSYLTFANAGVQNGDVVTYVIEEGANREIGRGTYTSSGTTLSRDTVLNSTNGGAKINLAGAATVFIDVAAQDIWNTVWKTADTTRNTNTTTSADPDLQFGMLASTTYAIRIVVKLRSTAAGDFKWGLSGPASPTEVYGSDVAAAQFGNAQTFEAYPTNLSLLGSAAGAKVLVIELTVENGANAGTFSFDWAQNTSDAGPTTVKAGSYIEYRTY